MEAYVNKAVAKPYSEDTESSGVEGSAAHRDKSVGTVKNESG